MESSQEKSLPATERKLEQARKDGQAARSRDLAHLAILGSGALGLLIFGRDIMEHMRLAITDQLTFDARAVMTPSTMLLRLSDMTVVGLVIATALAILTGGAAIAGAIASGGWLLSSKAIAPQFNRLNPLSGAANLFSKNQMTNVAKMVLMTTILSAVAWSFMSGSLSDVASLVMQPSPMALRYVGQWLTSGMSLLLLVVFMAALIDVPLQIYFFKDRLKMSHEDVKQENKESDGNPHTKGRIRQKQREMADRASISAVPKADLVVMNPTHYAVALKYDDATMHAPQVIARGTDLVALRIRDVATSHSIPVLQSPMLARALYAHAELDQPIPTTLYNAVAQILAYVYRLKAALRGEGIMPDAVPEPFVPPELDPLHKPDPHTVEEAP